MWGFSEKEIERRLTVPDGKLRPLPIEVDDVRYEVLATQAGLVLPEKSKRSPWQPLFAELAGLKDFLPELQGKLLLPDMIARRGFKRGMAKGRKKTLAIIELKKGDATVGDVAQLRRYMNLLAFCLEHDLDGIRAKLGVGGRCPVRGVLLAPHIPKEVWMSACPTSEPDIDLIAYELVSDTKARRIQGINYLDCGKRYAKDLRNIGRKYRADRKLTPDLPVDSALPEPDLTDSVSQVPPFQTETPQANRPSEGDVFESGESGGPPTVGPDGRASLFPSECPRESDLADPNAGR